MTSIDKFKAATEIAQRALERFEQIRKDQFKENPERSWDGSEDYADAVSYIGDLFQAVSAQMLFEAYDGSVWTDALFTASLKKRLDEANEDAMHALQQLSIFQLTTPTIDDI